MNPEEELARDLVPRTYGIVPAGLALDKELSKLALRVGILLAALSDKQRRSWPSTATVAEVLQADRRDVVRALKELVDRKHTYRFRNTESGRGLQASIYELRFDVAVTGEFLATARASGQAKLKAKKRPSRADGLPRAFSGLGGTVPPPGAKADFDSTQRAGGGELAEPVGGKAGVPVGGRSPPYQNPISSNDQYSESNGADAPPAPERRLIDLAWAALWPGHKELMFEWARSKGGDAAAKVFGLKIRNLRRNMLKGGASDGEIEARLAVAASYAIDCGRPDVLAAFAERALRP